MDGKHLCGAQTNNGILIYRCNDISNADSQSYIYKYNVITKEYVKDKATAECKCNPITYEFENKFIRKLGEDYKQSEFNYNEFLVEVEEERKKKERES